VPVVLAAGLFALSLVTVPVPLDADVRYEIGAQATSPADAAGTFTHRPLMYRLLMAALVKPADGLTDGVLWFERLMRLEALGLAFLAGLLLFLGLRRHLPSIAATLSLAVTATLCLIQPAIVLEAEWLALVVTVAGVGAALALPNRPPWSVLSGCLGGVLLMMAAAIKVVTLPGAIVGLLALLLLDRRRCLIATTAAFLSGLAYLGAVALWAPWEIQWIIDSGTMVPPRDTSALKAGVFLGNVAIIWPAVALLPAALVSLPRTPALVATIGALLTWLPVTIQNQYFLYHASGIVLVAAVCLFGAVGRSGPVVVLPILALSGWTFFVLSSDPEWRVSHQPLLFTVAGATAAVALALAVALRLWRGANGRRALSGLTPGLTLMAALLVTATSLPASAPTAAESVTLVNRARTPQKARALISGQVASSREVRRRIGPDTRVTYLTYGSVNYLINLPGTCEIPTSVFLQRSRSIKRQEGTPTWEANLRCLTDKPGEMLVWDPKWFLLRRQPPAVKAAIAAGWDCERGFTHGQLRVCPRRSGPGH
jgi:hypothetical protein